MPEELKKETIVEEVGSGCNDVYYKFLEDLQNLYKRPPSNEDRIDPVGFLKSFISSLLAKQQMPTAMTNSEWVAYGKKMGYHDYWKDMTRIAVEEEFVKCLPEEKDYKVGSDGEYHFADNMKTDGYNQCIADIKSKLNK
jgi:hypothetical protein